LTSTKTSYTASFTYNGGSKPFYVTVEGLNSRYTKGMTGCNSPYSVSSLTVTGPNK